MRALLIAGLAGAFCFAGCSAPRMARLDTAVVAPSPPSEPSPKPAVLPPEPASAPQMPTPYPSPPEQGARPDKSQRPPAAGRPSTGRPRPRPGAPGTGSGVPPAARDDTVRISGDTVLTEGVVYSFTLEIAKRMALAARRADAEPIIVQETVPMFGDSARACLEGVGFQIELAGEQGRGTCRVTTLKDSAQRLWTWNVRPDTVSRAHGQQRAERRLLFTLKSYPEGTRADFERSYPVIVHIVPQTTWERFMDAVTSTQVLVAALAAIATALATIYGYLRRKPGG